MSAPLEDLEALRARDAEARSLAQRFEAPLVIEAGAGTGKTATLVARVLAWCLGPGWERAAGEAPDADDAILAERILRGVVAITFTEAAAAEMDGRIERGLALLAKGERPPGFDAEAPRERVQALRSAVDHLAVQTIHAWCRRLLSDHPLEAGVHPLFEVDADGAAREAVVREVTAERLGEGYAARDPALLALAERGVGPGEIERALTAQLEAGADAVAFADDPLAPQRIEALQARLLSAHCALEDAGGGLLATAKRAPRGAAVVESLANAQSALSKPATGPAELALLCKDLTDAWQGTALNALSKWKAEDFGKAERAAFSERSPAIAEAARNLHALLDKHVDSLDPEATALIAPVLSSLGIEVEERLRRGGRLGFDALLSRTAKLLGRADVAARLRVSIDQLLVDEFQDTDPRQCAIVATLALEGPRGERPGLFLVGDPKQSIYGWRSADLAAYEDLLDKIRDEGGRIVPLSVNHRSVPAVLEAVERAVKPVMKRVARLQPEFRGLAPSEALEGEAGFGAAGRAPVELWLPASCDADGAPQKTASPRAAAIEARALARDLRALHDEAGVKWEEVGLLFRSRGEWDVYLGALREADIPYRVEGDRSYYRRREILDAASLVCAVLDPNDALALVALLRSSVAGVPDAAWIPLWERGLPERAGRLGIDADSVSELRALLSRVARELDPALPGLSRVAGWEVAAGDCLEAVAALRRSFESEAGDHFVERLRALTAFEGLEANRFPGRWRSANLERFFSSCAESFAGAGSADAVLSALRRAVAEEELPSLEPAVLDSGDAVSVVTLHGAKGLAWEHVYLMQLHKGEAPQELPDEAGWVDGRLESRSCRWPTLGRDILKQRRERVSEAELVRTLYVGMTRARRRLVLSGVWPALMSRGARCHTTLLADGFGSDVDLGALAARADAQGRVDEGGWRWVFVDHVEQAGVAAEPAAAATVEPAARAPGTRAAPAPDFERVARRMQRRRAAPVTLLSERGDAKREDAAASPRGTLDGDTARGVGTAIHAALERLDLDAPPEQAFYEQRARIEAQLRGALPAARAARAVAEALALWDVVHVGPLAARLADLAPRVVARELPVLLPLDETPEADAEYASGSIDLLYRDPDGRLVVADYKTDRADPRAADPDTSAARAAYARQGSLYRTAVARALPGEPPPRFELWWLRRGEVETLLA